MSFEQSSEWFYRLFGFEEEPLQLNQQLEAVEDKDGIVYIETNDGSRRHMAGKFEIRHLSSFTDLKEIGGGTLNLLIGTGEYGPTDIMNIESNPENDGSTIQIASNFNCLDHIPSHPKYRPPLGKVSDYITYMVQAPPADVACGPALIYRQYFLPLRDGKIGQLEENLNLIESTPIEVHDGYTTKVPTTDWNWNNDEHYPIGLHSHAAVTLGRHGEEFEMIERNQIVHQVFCSAVAFNIFPRNPQTEEIAAKIIEVEYKETIMAAWECSLKYPDHKGSKKLFLTLIGGGVFKNPLSSIVSAIEKCEELIKKSGLEVFITLFSSAVAMNFAEPFMPIIERTGGKVINYN